MKDRIILGFILIIILAGIWGIICPLIFPYPFSTLFAVLGGGFIGYTIDKLVMTKDEES